MRIFFISIAAFYVLNYGAILYNRHVARKRNNVLKSNNYFVGANIDEVVDAIGTFSKKSTRWNSCTNYFFGLGNDSALLICDENGRVIDYCPSQMNWKTVKPIFENNKENLINLKVGEIKKLVGESHYYASLDFGIAVDEWHGPNDNFIQVWSKSESCTDVIFKTKK